MAALNNAPDQSIRLASHSQSAYATPPKTTMAAMTIRAGDMMNSLQTAGTLILSLVHKPARLSLAMPLPYALANILPNVYFDTFLICSREIAF
jgi:hypothetical protein